jgi:hypothetical protein
MGDLRARSLRRTKNLPLSATAPHRPQPLDSKSPIGRGAGRAELSLCARARVHKIKRQKVAVATNAVQIKQTW